MGTLQQTGLITFAEFENLPDPPEGHLELHHGQVVLMPPRKLLHAIAQEALSDLLKPLARDVGFVGTEFPFRPSPEYEFWQADIGFVAKERWTDDADYYPGAPDLVIEVLSPSNTKAEVIERREACLSNGCTAFWSVDPRRRHVQVTGPDRKTITHDSSMSIPLPPPMSGEIPVAAIFEQPFSHT